MALCRAGRGSENLPAEAACPQEATRPSIRGGRRLRWCDEHADALRRVALDLGSITPDADELRAALLAAADEPRLRGDLAAAIGLTPARHAFVTALGGALASGDLVEQIDGNAKRYVRPDAVQEPAAVPPASGRRPRSEQAAELARLIKDNGGSLTREAAVQALDIAPTSLGHLLAVGRGHRWIETRGRKDPDLYAGEVAPPEAIAA